MDIAPLTRLDAVNAADETHDLTVGPDGSISAEQVARLGVRPGAHLRVVPASPAEPPPVSLPQDFPDLSWEDFERASRLAADDLTAA